MMAPRIQRDTETFPGGSVQNGVRSVANIIIKGGDTDIDFSSSYLFHLSSIIKGVSFGLGDWRLVRAGPF